MAIDKSINVLGTKLKICSCKPLTGYYRDGFCNTSDNDLGMHTVCVIATKEFLEYSKSVGNDLTTDNPSYNFIGLNPGDKWCLCANRWKQAEKANCAPPVILESTHYKTLKVVDIYILQKYSIN